MISAPAFPPPDPADPDEVGWPLCTAAAMWRSGRYRDAIGHVETAASAAFALGDRARCQALAAAAEQLSDFVQRWESGMDADPLSVPVSAEYPSIELLESVAEEAGTTLAELARPILTAGYDAPPPSALTLPAGVGDAPKRKLPPLRRVLPGPAPAPLRLDFEGSILGPKPVAPKLVELDDEPPTTVRSDRPPPRR